MTYVEETRQAAGGQSGKQPKAYGQLNTWVALGKLSESDGVTKPDSGPEPEQHLKRDRKMAAQ